MNTLSSLAKTLFKGRHTDLRNFDNFLTTMIDINNDKGNPEYPFDFYYRDKFGTYIGSEIYAELDELDHILCIHARQLGFDTILLQREPGEHRVVTVILDTRSQ